MSESVYEAVLTVLVIVGALLAVLAAFGVGYVVSYLPSGRL